MTIPTELYRAVTSARAAGLLETVCWCPRGVLLARLRGDDVAVYHAPQEIPAYLAGAIARTTGRRDLPWRYLLDAMEDLAEVWPWTMVEP